MQVYMRKMGLQIALYFAVNKNDDDIYVEFVQLNIAVADQYIERARTVIFMRKEPDKINPSPGYWKCKFCDYAPVCHHGATPERNCRTCVYSVPLQTGEKEWGCERHGHKLS